MPRSKSRKQKQKQKNNASLHSEAPTKTMDSQQNKPVLTHEVSELIEPLSNFDRILSKPTVIGQAFRRYVKQSGNEISRLVESIMENGLECKKERQWLAVRCLGDMLLASTPDGILFSFDSRSGEICWSIPTGGPLHVSHQSSENNLPYIVFCGGERRAYKYTKDSKPVDLKCHASELVEKPYEYLNGVGFIVAKKSESKLHVNPGTGQQLSPLTSDGVHKLKEVTKDSSGDELLCIARFDFEVICYKPGTVIVLWYRRVASFNISIVSRDGAVLHEKSYVPARQGQYLLTPGTICNTKWSGKVIGNDGKDTVQVGEHDLGIDVICIEKGQSDDDAVKKEVSIVSAACNGNLNVVKVYCVESDHDFYKVFTERCGRGLREFILSSRKDHKILMKLISGIVTGIARLHDKGIFLGNLELNDISVDEDYNAKISIISTKTKFPLISSSKGATDDMLVVGHIIFFGYTGVEYKGEDLTKPKPSDDYLNTLYDSPKALDLLRKLLNEDRMLRPTAAETYSHSVFWDPDTEFSFFRDVRVRLREDDPSSDLLIAIENIKPDVFVERWDTYINGDLLKEMNKHCWYNYWRVRDLIRFIRNDATYNSKRSGLETDLDTYFPELVIKLYEVMKTHCGEELAFKRYFKRTPVAT